MAHLRVTVCLPPEAADDLEAALDAALAPFYTDGEDVPVGRGMWDWRRVQAASDRTGFAVAPGHEGDPRLIHDDPDPDGTPRPSPPGVCAGGPRELLDFTEPPAACRRVLAASWDLWQELSGVHPVAEPLQDFVRRWEDDPGARVTDPYGDEALAAYRNQPLIKAYMEHPFSLGLGFPDFPFLSEHPVIRYPGDRDAYIRELSWSTPVETDVLTLDGWWREADGGAVHGTCDPAFCPHRPEPAEWPGSEAHLAGLPGDTVLVRLRCHC
ncbi:hypothetical protein ACFVXW_14305 [Streptomyces sp. NPDC058251]|uniref:hypothetical protein n=1 Tax=unclassified Streptomyces TaxID=2593676 RepID=UPI003669AAE2